MIPLHREQVSSAFMWRDQLCEAGPLIEAALDEAAIRAKDGLVGAQESSDDGYGEER